MWKMRLLREKIEIEPKFFILGLILFLIVASNYFFDIFSAEVKIILIQFSMLFGGLSFIYKKNLKKTFENLNIFLDLKNTVLFTGGGIVIIFAFLIVLGILFNVFEIHDYSKVTDKMQLFTPLIFLSAVTLGPVAEEIFFRAFLIKRTGIIFSSALFALAHIAYGSIAEIIGAFGIGIILALIFLRSKSILPCILIHVLYNLSALILFWWFY